MGNNMGSNQSNLCFPTGLCNLPPSSKDKILQSSKEGKTASNFTACFLCLTVYHGTSAC